MTSVTTAQVKSYLAISYDDQNDTIDLIIAGIDEQVERICGIKLASATRTENLDGGERALWPTGRPVTSVTSVTDRESEAERSESEYSLEGNAILRTARDDRWEDEPAGRFTVVYVGGYATIPGGLKLAILDMCARRYYDRGGKMSQSAAGYGTAWAEPWPKYARKLLSPWRAGPLVVG